MKNTGKLWILPLLLLTLSSLSVGQELRGKVQGIVSDTTGAVIAGANLKLRNDETGTEMARQTNAVGRYIFDFIPAGQYTLTVESEGFRTYVQRNIRVQTRDDITVNIPMELGAVSETINVTESPVQVEFNTTSMETTIDTKMSNNLPIIHRNPFLLATLNPAVVVRSTTEQSPYHHWAASQLDVGGGTSTKNDILIDGVPQLVGAKGSYVPPMDAVSEVNVQQNGVDAEFGHSAGGIISVQMKSGTNDWHGTAYYFGRNPALNAVADSTTHRPNLVRNHVFGATSANPILKNRVFNFFAYESHDVKEPRTLSLTLPTERERRGDFSQSFNSAGGLRTIHDPFTTTLDPVTKKYTRQAFPGNVIPANRIDPTAARFLADIWQPNNPGDNITGANNFRETFPQKFDYWNLSDRVDWNIKDNWRTFGRISRFYTLQSDPNFTGSPAQPLAGSKRHTWQVSGDAVWTVNPTTVFNIRGSYSKITDSFEAENARIDESKLAELWPGNPWYDLYQRELPATYYPGLRVNGETNSTFGRDGFWFQEPKTWNLQSKLSKSLGRHYVKVGGEFRQQIVLASRPRPMGFTFVKDNTASTFQSPNTKVEGDAWASFLLGVVDQRSRIQHVPLNKPRNGFWGFYVQDDLKLSRNVTLNLGLRYEYQTAIYDPENRLSRFLDLDNPIPEFQNNAPQLPAEARALRRSAPVYNGAWVFTDSDNRGAWRPATNIFLPRIGVALRLDDRTALRVGYARYATASDSARDIVDVLGSTPYPGFDAVTNPLPVLEGVPQAVLSDPYPTNRNPLIPPVGKTIGRYTGLGSDVTYFHQDFQNEINDRFNISLQREIFARIVTDVTYFSSYGHNAPQTVNLNLADPRIAFENGQAVNKKVDNPFYQVLPEDKFQGQLRNQRQVNVSTLLSPYPQYGDIEVRGVPLRNTRYQALQLSAQRPFTNGFNFLIGYNFNKGSAQQFYDDVDHFDRRLSYQSTNGELPQQKLTIASIYELPFGRGRTFLNDSPKVVDAIFGGWSLGGIYIHTSGTLLRFNGMQLVGDPLAGEQTRERWFNTDAFKVLPAFTRRSNPWFLDGLTGPGFRNLDMTLSKEFAITERVSFELKMEAYNATNSFMGADPSTNVTAGNFGQVVNQLNGYSGRQFQYNGRFRW